jgi:hypothetical protein
MPDAAERARLLEKAVSRWENEGGAVAPARSKSSSKATTHDAAAGNAELVQLQVRILALENLVKVLLAASSQPQLDLAQEMAAYIAPRQGSAPHRLTAPAAAKMVGLIEAAGHLRALCLPD